MNQTLVTVVHMQWKSKDLGAMAIAGGDGHRYSKKKRGKVWWVIIYYHEIRVFVADSSLLKPI